jgi:MFS family permease
MAGARGRWRAFASDAGAALRESPGLRFLLAMNLLASFLAGLLIPVLPLFLVDRGFSLLQLGGLFSLVALSTLAVQALAGRWHRVLGRRGVVVALQGLTVVTFPAFLFVTTPLELVLVTGLASFAGGASGPGLATLLAEAAPVGRQASLFAYFGVVGSLSYAGAVVVGYALSDTSYAAVLFLGTALALLSVLLMGSLLFRDRLTGQAARLRRALTPEERALQRSAARGLALARASAMDLGAARLGLEGRLPQPRQAARNVRWACVHLLLFGFALAIYPVYFPLHLLDLGLPRAWGGVVIAASWVTFALAQPFGGRFADRTGKHRQLIVACLAAAAVLNLVLATGPLAWVVAAWVLFGIADGLGRPVTMALIASSVPASGRASAFGWTQAAMTAARVAGPFAIAFAIQARDIGFGLLLVTALIAAAALPMARLRPLPPASNAPRPAGGPA